MRPIFTRFSGWGKGVVRGAYGLFRLVRGFFRKERLLAARKRVARSVSRFFGHVFRASRFWEWDFGAFRKTVVFMVRHPRRTMQVLLAETRRFARWWWKTWPRRLFASAIIAAVVVMPISNLLFVKPAQAEWFDDAWLYRKAIAVTNNTTEEYDVYVALSLDTSDTTRFQDDCGDLRFTDIGGSVLGYYLVSGCGTSGTSLHVNIPVFPAGAQTMYVYYGNVAAADGFSDDDFPTEASDYTVGATGSEERGPGPAAYWKFDEGTGTVAHDSVTGGGSASAEATGGTITEVGGYRIHTFTSGTDTFVPAADGDVEVLVVAGGGAGGCDTISWGAGGGGGAGGVLHDSAYTVTAGTGYSVSVGAGGVAGGASDEASGSGGNSVFDTLTAIGGGGGGNSQEADGAAGGSGGGGGNEAGIGGSGTSGQGYAGGDGGTWGTYNSGSGGGGGAAGVGDDLGYPGDGVQYDTSGTATYYGGGGGGAADGSGQEGGLGGGGDGQGSSVTPPASSNGEPNTGGGGGGNGTDGGTSLGGAGGSGVVIVRYPLPEGARKDGELTNMASGAFPDSGWQPASRCVSGKCLAFDGTNDFVDMPIPIPVARTVSFWVRPVTTTQSIAQLSAGVSVSSSGGTVSATGFTSPTIYVNGRAGGTVAANTWNYIAITTTTSVTADAVRFGVVGSTYFQGSMDEPKIYPYARTAAQVLQDYEAGLAGIGADKGATVSFGGGSEAWMSDGLVGYWKTDETGWDGTTGEVKDWSGNGNHGTAAGDATTAAGKFGNGGRFDGTDDWVSFGSPSDLSFGTGSFSVCMWAKVSGSEPSYQTFFSKGDDGGTGSPDNAYSLGLGDDGYVTLEMYDSGGTPYAIVGSDDLRDDSWHHYCGTRNGDVTEVFVDGESVARTENAAIGAISAGGTGIASISRTVDYDPVYDLNGSVDEIRAYGRALSLDEVAKLADWAPGPVGHWMMDENTGTAAYDSSGYGNDGVLAGGASWASGRIGSSVDFDGTDGVMTVPTSDSLNSGDVTVSMWIHMDSDPDCNANNNWRFLYQNYGYRVIVEESGAIVWDTLDSNEDVDRWWPNNYGLIIPLGQWMHLTLTYDSDGEKLAYVNGKLSDSKSVAALELATGPEDFVISRDATACQTYDGSFPGKVDDVRVYDYVRTPEQIVEDMNGVTDMSGHHSSKEAMFHWKFDEGTGTTAHDGGTDGYDGTLTNMAFPATSASGWRPTDRCVSGRCLAFDGTDDYVDIGNPFIGGPTTVDAWIYDSDIYADSARIIEFGNGENSDNVLFSHYGSTGRLAIEAYDGSTSGGAIYTTDTIPPDRWVHVTGVFDGENSRIYWDGVLKASGTTADVNYVGRTDGLIGKSLYAADDYFSGRIDELKVFPYALSESDVKSEQNLGAAASMAGAGPLSIGGSSSSGRAEYCPPGDDGGNCATGQDPFPVGEWRFDEGTGTTAGDTSGNGNDGTLANGPLWSSGKIGKALKFDGVNDAVTTSSNLTGINVKTATISMWFKSPTVGSYADDALLELSGDFNANDAFAVFFNGNSAGTPPTMGGLLLYMHSAAGYSVFASNNRFDDGEWHHVEVIFDRNQSTAAAQNTLYVDGKRESVTQIGSYGAVHTTSFTSRPIYVAARGGSSYPFAGSIDQVRIYGYVRTPAQVAWDYDRGGPVGWWKMDECQGGTIHDSSGNGNDGTLTIGGSGTQSAIGTCQTSSTAWGNGATGRFGASLNLDGSDDYVNQSASIASVQGVSFWVKPTTSTQSFLQLASGVSVASSGGTVSASGFATPTIYVNGAAGGAVTAGAWNHVVVTTDTALTADAIRLGLVGSTYCSGQIDDVRVFNYALSVDQIKLLYNGGASLRFGN